jgi:hypothetical protein
MPRELVNANITHVSYVDKAANQKQFFFTKSADSPNFEKEVKIFINKEDEEQQLVYGVVYEPEIEDAHGDFMTAPEIEKAAHGFMKDARNIDKQHDFNSGVGEVVESYIAPVDMTIGEETITKGSWVLVTKATEEVWEEIKKGEITGYSMAGTAETIEKQEKEKPVSKSEEDEEFKGFFNVLKNFFTGKTSIEKGELRDNYERNQKRRNLWAAWDGLDDIYYSSLWDNMTPDVTDFQRLKEGVQEFLEILQEIEDNGDIEKALESKPIQKNKGDEEMKKEDIEKLLDEKLNPITKKLDELEKEENQEGNEDQEEDVMKQFAAVLDEKLSPINKRLETVEKARGISKQVDQDDAQTQQTEVQKGYMRLFN